MAGCQASDHYVELLKCEEAFKYEDTELDQQSREDHHWRHKVQSFDCFHPPTRPFGYQDQGKECYV